MIGDITVVGAGGIGRNLASSIGVEAIPQRQATDLVLLSGGVLIIAGGRSSVGASDDVSMLIEEECSALRSMLEHAGQVGCRVVVLGSSDVCGSAEIITGATPVNPLTPYARLKAAREHVVVDAVDAGVDAVIARIAPVHGPGKAQSARLVRLSRRRLIAVPGGTSHSVGFVTLADLTRAILSLTTNGQRGVVSIGHADRRPPQGARSSARRHPTIDLGARSVCHAPRAKPIDGYRLARTVCSTAEGGDGGSDRADVARSGS